MKYRIEYREYDDADDQGRLVEFLSAVDARSFMFENGFVSIWTESGGTQTPDLYVNANDVLTIKQID
jgi:hypothetical protein